MKKLFSLFKRAPKRMTAAVLMLALAIIIPAATFAWGPSRQTYTIENPADHVVFNSITNNPSQGDERNFMQVREANANNSTYADSIALQPSHQYVVFIYYHNNAASNLNASGKGIAHGAYTKAQIPAIVPAGSTGTTAEGYVGAANADPAQVWDEVNFQNPTTGDIALRYVPGSATIHNFGKSNGATMSDNIVTTGAPLGYDSLNGDVPGCNDYAGYVTFRVEADQANFTLQKLVRVKGTSTWSKSVTANPGDTVQYELAYQNTGNTQQNNVVLKDTLPKNVSYVNGTSLLKNAANPNAKTVSDDVTGAGVNIGNYTPTSNAYMMFDAKIASSKDLPCGTSTLTNTGYAVTNNGTKSDTATVTVNNNCKPPVQPSCTCKALTATLVSDSTYKFNGTGEAQNGATITGYSLDFGDGSTPYTGTSVAGVTHTYPADGNTYTARLSVTVMINGSTQTITSDACAVKITTKKPPVTPVYTCKDLTATLVSDSTYKFSGTAEASNGATITGYTLDFGDGTAIFQGSAVKDVTHTYSTASDKTYTARLTALVSVNGETKSVTSDDCAVKITTKKPPVTPVYTCTDLTATLVSDSTYKFSGSAEASNGATITGYTLDFGDNSTPFTGTAVSDVTHTYAQTGDTYTARLTANVSINDSTKTVTSDACTVKITAGQPPVTPPTTPPELPHTGASSTVASIAGLGAIVLSLGYYIASRRAAMGR